MTVLVLSYYSFAYVPRYFLRARTDFSLHLSTDVLGRIKIDSVKRELLYRNGVVDTLLCVVWYDTVRLARFRPEVIFRNMSHLSPMVGVGLNFE